MDGWITGLTICGFVYWIRTLHGCYLFGSTSCERYNFPVL